MSVNISMNSERVTSMYLDLLKKCLTGSLMKPEPDRSVANKIVYAHEFTKHYINGPAVTMLPRARLDNLQLCMETCVSDGIPGDFLEAGVWRGGATIFMSLLCRIMSVDDRNVWVADSFQGLPEPDKDKFPREAATHSSRLMTQTYGHLAVSLEEVRDNFSLYSAYWDNVKFLPGWFDKSLADERIKRLCLLRVDADYFKSTLDCLTLLWDKLEVGGFVIIDDYGLSDLTSCKMAVDEFREQRHITTPLTYVDEQCIFWRKTD